MRGARWRGVIAALAAVLAAGSLAWAGSAVASGSGGGDVWFTQAQNAGGGLGDNAYGYSIAVTSEDTPILTGYFSGTLDFPTGPNSAISLSSVGEDDIFVAALNTDDSYFAWAVAAGGGGNVAYGQAISVTGDDTPIITGGFDGTIDFPTRVGTPISLTAASAGDVFVAGLNPDDSTFAWAVSAGGSGTDYSYGFSVAVTSDDTPIVTGYFSGAIEFPTGPSTSISLSSAGNDDIFMAALNSDDSYFAWAVSVGGSGYDYGYALDVTADDTPIVVGSFQGTVGFPTKSGTPISLSASGPYDVFVAAMNADDPSFAWAVSVGDTSNLTYGEGIAITGDDTPIITGRFDGTIDFPTRSGVPISLTASGSTDIFVAALNADDSTFAWAVSAGGLGADAGFSVTVTEDDSPVIVGKFRGSASFPTGPNADDSIVLTSTGQDDIFVAAVNDDDSYFAWAIRAGASSDDQGRSVALTADDSPIITGYIGSGTSYFPTSPLDDSIPLSNDGSNDAFVAWLGPYVAPPPAPAITGVNPATGSVTGGTSVTITGTDLTGATAVTFGGIAATTITSNTATQIVATSPAGAAGSVDVAVTTAGGTATSANAFTYTSDPDPDPGPQPVRPSAPIRVMAAAGDASAVVSWGIPESHGSFPISTYQVVVSPGGATCLAEAPKTACSVSRLTNGDSYTAQVRALSGAGWGAYSAASPEFTPRADDPSIMITGTRGEVRGRPGVVVNGTTSGFGEGAILRPWVRFPGQINYAEGTADILVDDDGTFTWQRRTGKKTYVVIKTPDGDVKSNRVIIPARE